MKSCEDLLCLPDVAKVSVPRVLVDRTGSSRMDLPCPFHYHQSIIIMYLVITMTMSWSTLDAYYVMYHLSMELRCRCDTELRHETLKIIREEAKSED